MLQGMANRQDDVHIGGNAQVDVLLHGQSAARAHRLQQIHPDKEPKGNNITKLATLRAK